MIDYDAIEQQAVSPAATDAPAPPSIDYDALEKQALRSYTPDEIRQFVVSKAKQYGVPEDLALRVAGRENGFQAAGTSPKGATGPMQLMPGTARDMGATDRFDPQQNVDAGVKYLGQMLGRYPGDTRKALAAYNFGPGNVDANAPWPKETRAYVDGISPVSKPTGSIDYDALEQQALGGFPTTSAPTSTPPDTTNLMRGNLQAKQNWLAQQKQSLDRQSAALDDQQGELMGQRANLELLKQVRDLEQPEIDQYNRVQNVFNQRVQAYQSAGARYHDIAGSSQGDVDAFNQRINELNRQAAAQADALATYRNKIVPTAPLPATPGTAPLPATPRILPAPIQGTELLGGSPPGPATPPNAIAQDQYQPRPNTEFEKRMWAARYGAEMPEGLGAQVEQQLLRQPAAMITHGVEQLAEPIGALASDVGMAETARFGPTGPPALTPALTKQGALGLTNIIGGTMQAASPLLLPALTLNPVGAIAVPLAAHFGNEATTKGLQSLGAAPEYANLGGTLVSLAVVGGGFRYLVGKADAALEAHNRVAETLLAQERQTGAMQDIFVGDSVQGIVNGQLARLDYARGAQTITRLSDGQVIGSGPHAASRLGFIAVPRGADPAEVLGDYLDAQYSQAVAQRAAEQSAAAKAIKAGQRDPLAEGRVLDLDARISEIQKQRARAGREGTTPPSPGAAPRPTPPELETTPIGTPEERAARFNRTPSGPTPEPRGLTYGELAALKPAGTAPDGTPLLSYAGPDGKEIFKGTPREMAEWLEAHPTPPEAPAPGPRPVPPPEEDAAIRAAFARAAQRRAGGTPPRPEISTAEEAALELTRNSRVPPEPRPTLPGVRGMTDEDLIAEANQNPSPQRMQNLVQEMRDRMEEESSGQPRPEPVDRRTARRAKRLGLEVEETPAPTGSPAEPPAPAPPSTSQSLPSSTSQEEKPFGLDESKQQAESLPDIQKGQEFDTKTGIMRVLKTGVDKDGKQVVWISQKTPFGTTEWAEPIPISKFRTMIKPVLNQEKPQAQQAPPSQEPVGSNPPGTQPPVSSPAPLLPSGAAPTVTPAPVGPGVSPSETQPTAAEGRVESAWKTFLDAQIAANPHLNREQMERYSMDRPVAAGLLTSGLRSAGAEIGELDLSKVERLTWSQLRAALKEHRGDFPARLLAAQQYIASIPSAKGRNYADNALQFLLGDRQQEPDAPPGHLFSTSELLAVWDELRRILSAIPPPAHQDAAEGPEANQPSVVQTQKEQPQSATTPSGESVTPTSVTMPRDDFEKEHTDLPEVLRHGTPEERAAEADKQAKELEEVKNAAPATPTGSPAEPVLPTATQTQHTEAAPERPTYPDGRLIPQEGDEVYQTVRGFGGGPAYVYGTVERMKNAPKDLRGPATLRVRVTGGASMIGTAGNVGKLYPVDGSWTVKNDPLIKQREDAAEAKRNQEKSERDREQAADNAKRQAFFDKYGKPDASKVEQGDILETYEGARYIAHHSENGIVDGYPENEPDSSYPVTFGSAWRDTGEKAGADFWKREVERARDDIEASEKMKDPEATIAPFREALRIAEAGLAKAEGKPAPGPVEVPTLPDTQFTDGQFRVMERGPDGQWRTVSKHHTWEAATEEAVKQKRAAPGRMLGIATPTPKPQVTPEVTPQVSGNPETPFTVGQHVIWTGMMSGEGGSPAVVTSITSNDLPSGGSITHVHIRTSSGTEMLATDGTLRAATPEELKAKYEPIVKSYAHDVRFWEQEVVDRRRSGATAKAQKHNDDALASARASLAVAKRMADAAEKSEPFYFAADDRASTETSEYPIQGGRVVVNRRDSKLQIYFDEKPSKIVRENLKRDGFHWKPAITAWEQGLTDKAKRAAERQFGLRLFEAPPAAEPKISAETIEPEEIQLAHNTTGVPVDAIEKTAKTLVERGAAERDGVHAKIVPHPSAPGQIDMDAAHFAVEVTRNGVREELYETPLTLDAARRAAMRKLYPSTNAYPPAAKPAAAPFTRTTPALNTPDRAKLDATDKSASDALEEVWKQERELDAEIAKTKRYTKKYEALEAKRQKLRDNESKLSDLAKPIHVRHYRALLEDAAEQTSNPVLSAVARLGIEEQETDTANKQAYSRQRSDAFQQASKDTQKSIEQQLAARVPALDGEDKHESTKALLATLTPDELQRAQSDAVHDAATGFLQHPLTADDVDKRLGGALYGARMGILRQNATAKIDGFLKQYQQALNILSGGDSDFRKFKRTVEDTADPERIQEAVKDAENAVLAAQQQRRLQDEAEAKAARERAESLRPINELEAPTIREKGLWNGNAVSEGNIVSDGRTLFDTRFFADKKRIQPLRKADTSHIVPQPKVQEAFDKAVAAATDPLRELGQYQETDKSGGTSNYAYLLGEHDKTYSFNGKMIRWIRELTGADEMRGGELPRPDGTVTPIVVYYQGGKPVAAQAGYNPAKVPGIDVEAAKSNAGLTGKQGQAEAPELRSGDVVRFTGKRAEYRGREFEVTEAAPGSVRLAGIDGWIAKRMVEFVRHSEPKPDLTPQLKAIAAELAGKGHIEPADRMRLMNAIVKAEGDANELHGTNFGLWPNWAAERYLALLAEAKASQVPQAPARQFKSGDKVTVKSGDETFPGYIVHENADGNYLVRWDPEGHEGDSSYRQQRTYVAADLTPREDVAPEPASEELDQDLVGDIADDLAQQINQQPKAPRKPTRNQAGPRTSSPAPAPKTAEEKLTEAARQALKELKEGPQFEREAGERGPIFREFRHNEAGATAALKAAQGGEAIGALRLPAPFAAKYGDVDMVWGYRGIAPPRWKKGYGIAHIFVRHPWLEGHLQEMLDRMTHEKPEGPERRLLSNDAGECAVLALTWFGRERKTWLLTEYNPGPPATEGTLDGSDNLAAGEPTSPPTGGQVPLPTGRSLDVSGSPVTRAGETTPSPNIGAPDSTIPPTGEENKPQFEREVPGQYSTLEGRLAEVGIDKATLKRLSTLGAKYMVVDKITSYPAWADKMNADLGNAPDPARRDRVLRLAYTYASSAAARFGVNASPLPPTPIQPPSVPQPEFKSGDRVEWTENGKIWRGTVEESRPDGTLAIFMGMAGTSRFVVKKRASEVQAAGGESDNSHLIPEADQVIASFRKLIHDGSFAIDSNPALMEHVRQITGRPIEAGQSNQIYDLLQTALNQEIAQYGGGMMMPEASVTDALANLRILLGKLPTQSIRSEEQIKYQQFSTPPTEALVVARVAAPTERDLAMESSAGTGGLAAFLRAAGARVLVNEITPRRAELLRRSGYEKVAQVDGEQIDNLYDEIWPDEEDPTLVVINPPFTAAGDRGVANSSQAGFNHVLQALRRLRQGGRLVAILGGGSELHNDQGASLTAPNAKPFWQKVRDSGSSIRANVRISGKEYAKYGTSFGNRIIVIDKVPPRPGVPQSPVQGDFDTLEEAWNALEPISRDRQDISRRNDDLRPGDRGAGAQPEREPGERGGVREPGGGPGGSVRHGPLGPDQPDSGQSGEEQPGGIRGGDAGGESGAGSQRPTAGDRLPSGVGVREPASNGPRVNEPAAPLEVNLQEQLAEAGRDIGDYVAYTPQVPAEWGAQPHQAVIVETQTMAAVPEPPITLKPNLPEAIIHSGAVSDVQLDAIAHILQAHQHMLEPGRNEQGQVTVEPRRLGYFLGDGTGVGKGRTIAGTALHYWRTNPAGKRKTVWISFNEGLATDARRDLDGVGATDIPVYSLEKVKPGKKLLFKDGVLFVPYSKLAVTQATKKDGTPLPKNATKEDKASGQKLMRRLAQIIEWAGEEPLVVFDECVPAGTLIETPNGPVAIENLKLGDFVLGLNHETGAIEPTEILHTFRRHTTEPLIQINGTLMTGNHPVWTENRGYVRADEICPIDLVGNIAAQLNCDGDRARLSLVSEEVHSEDSEHPKAILQRELQPQARPAHTPLRILPESVHGGLAERCTSLLQLPVLGQNEVQIALPVHLRVVQEAGDSQALECRPQGGQATPLLWPSVFGEVENVQAGICGLADYAKVEGSGPRESIGGAEAPGGSRKSPQAPGTEQSLSETGRAAEGNSDSGRTGLDPPQWREWHTVAGTCSLAIAAARLADGSSRSRGSAQDGQRESNLLSTRYSPTDAESSNRSGRMEPHRFEGEGSGPAEGSVSGSNGLDTPAIQKLPRADGFRECGSGGSAGREVFNIETGTGNYFANGLLVHNCHLSKNATPTKEQIDPKRTATKKATLRGRATVDLQNAIPKARVLYSSATGFSDVSNMAYANRLGLWGPGTAFKDFQDFRQQIHEGGLGVMEMVAQNLKAQGKYISRFLSYEGVLFDEAVHEITPEQHQLLDKAGDAWRTVLDSMEQAADENVGEDGDPTVKARVKSMAMSQLWGCELRFYRSLYTAMKVPRLMQVIDDALSDRDKDGKPKAPQAVVISVLETGAAQQEREAERSIKAGDDDLEGLDISPVASLIDMVDKRFPTIEYETVELEDGSKITRVKMIPDGHGGIKPAQNAEALRAKKALMEQLEKLKGEFPDAALDQIINRYGTDQVAELTKRSERLIRNPETGMREMVSRGNDLDKTNLREMAAFQNGDKFIALISNAASTGISLHSSLSAKNQRQRVHVLLQTKWSADMTLQDLGRTHRTAQVLPPHYILLSLNVEGEKRFIATVARRLEQLGALSRGERKAGGGGTDFSKYNFESIYGRLAVDQVIDRLFYNEDKYGHLTDERVQANYPEVASGRTVLNLMGLKPGQDKDGNEVSPDVPVNRFFNRLMLLPVKTQNALFRMFFDSMTRMVENAKHNGTFDAGAETIPATHLNQHPGSTPVVVFQDPITGAQAVYYRLQSQNPRYRVPWDSARQNIEKKDKRLYRVKASGRLLAIDTSGYAETDSETGRQRMRLWATSAAGGHDAVYQDELDGANSKYEPVKLSAAAEGEWKRQYDAAGEWVLGTENLITGSILPIWAKVQERTGEGTDHESRRPLKIRIAKLDNRQRLIGALIEPHRIAKVLNALGHAPTKTPDEVAHGLDHGKKFDLMMGATLKRSQVSGSFRWELEGARNFRNLFNQWGLRSETIGGKERWFLPTGNTDALKRVLKELPLRVDQAAEEEGEGPQFERAVPGFYSQLERVIQEKMPAKAGAGQVLAIINNPQSGVKPDESHWTGLGEWLMKQTGPVTKQQVLEFLKQNQVQLQETVLGEPKDKAKVAALETELTAAKQHLAEEESKVTTFKEGDRIATVGSGPSVGGYSYSLGKIYEAKRDAAGSLIWKLVTSFGGTRSGRSDKFVRELKAQAKYPWLDNVSNNDSVVRAAPRAPDVRYHGLWGTYDYGKSHELHGSIYIDNERALRGLLGDKFDEAYRKFLETKPATAPSGLEAASKEVARLTAALDRAQRGEGKPKYAKEWVLPGGKNPREFVVTVGGIEPWGESDKAHYGDVGKGRTIGWARVNDRKGPNGEKLLHIEEIQSKREQVGRKQGYKLSGAAHEDAIQRLGAAAQIERRLDEEARMSRDAIQHAATEGDREFFEAEYRQRKAALDQQVERVVSLQRQINGVPNAPLLQRYEEVIAKRLLRYAAENGYDGITWTTGNQQAERYSLEHAVSRIEYDPEQQLFWAYDKTGDQIRNVPNSIPADKLPEYIGENATKELLVSPMRNRAGEEITGHPAIHTLYPKDLKVGGEKHNVLYDLKLPKFLDKYGKKWGAKVGQTTISGAEGHWTDPVHGGVLHPTPGITPEQLRAQGWEYVQGPGPVHYFPITPAMRASVMEGQPLFERGAGEAKPTGPYAITYRAPKAGQPGAVLANRAGLDRLAAVWGEKPGSIHGMRLGPKHLRYALDKIGNSDPELTDAMKQSAADNYGQAIVIDRERWPRAVAMGLWHEGWHAAQALWSPLKNHLGESAKDLLEHPLAAEPASRLRAMGYREDELAAELGAHLVAGQYERLGLSRWQARELFIHYFTLLEKQYGAQPVEQVAGKLAPMMREALRDYRRRQAGNVAGRRGDTGRPGGQSPQGPAGGEEEPPSAGRGLRSDVPEFQRQPPGDEEPRLNYSGLGALKRIFLPGQSLAEVEKASPAVFEAALPAGAASSRASVILQNAMPAIAKALKGSGVPWNQMALAYVESRLRGCRDRWAGLAQTYSQLDDAALEREITSEASPVLSLLSHLEGRAGMAQNLGQTAAALAEAQDWSNLRAFLGQSFGDAARRVQPVMDPAWFDETRDAMANDPKVHQAHQIYKQNVERVMADNHALNEGVFSNALGPLDTYYPLIPIGRPHTSWFGRRLAYHKPKNQDNAFATGLSEAYDPTIAAFAQKLGSAIRANSKAYVIQTLLDSGWAKKQPLHWDGVFAGPDGAAYHGASQESSPARLLIQNGKVTHLPARNIIMPSFIERGLRPILARELADPNAVLGLMRWANMIATKGPFEFLFHSSGVLGALYANTPFLGASGLDKALSVPLAKFFAIRGKLLTIDPTAPENVHKLQELADAGALPARTGKVTYSREYAQQTGAQREIGFGPMLYGPKGMDTRARILMYDIFRAAFPHGTKTDLYHFVNQIGNYTPEFQGMVERWMKYTGIGPFATAGMTRLVNAPDSYTDWLLSWFGKGKFKNASPGAKAWMFVSGAVAALALWIIAHKLLTGKWPTEDRRAKLYQIPVGHGNGYIDAFRHSALGNAYWGRGPEVGYLNFSFFDPLALRGARLAGVPGLFQTLEMGGNAGQAFESAELDVFNSLTHPMLGPVARSFLVGASGVEPQVTGLHDNRGRPAPQFFKAIPANLKPGFVGGFAPALSSARPRPNAGFGAEEGAKAAAALRELNSFYGEIGEHTGMVGNDRGETGAWWARLLMQLNPLTTGLVGNATNPYRKVEALRIQRGGR